MITDHNNINFYTDIIFNNYKTMLQVKGLQTDSGKNNQKSLSNAQFWTLITTGFTFVSLKR